MRHISWYGRRIKHGMGRLLRRPIAPKLRVHEVGLCDGLGGGAFKLSQANSSSSVSSVHSHPGHFPLANGKLWGPTPQSRGLQRLIVNLIGRCGISLRGLPAQQYLGPRPSLVPSSSSASWANAG